MLAGPNPALRLQLDVPIQPVAPGFVQMVRREHLAMLLQLPMGGADRLGVEVHRRLLRSTAALLQIAAAARGGDVFPGCAPPQTARNHVIEGQIMRVAAILAGEPITQEQVEAGEGREF